MSKIMQAAFVRAPFEFECREVPVPQVKDGQVSGLSLHSVLGG